MVYFSRCYYTKTTTHSAETQSGLYLCRDGQDGDQVLQDFVAAPLLRRREVTSLRSRIAAMEGRRFQTRRQAPLKRTLKRPLKRWRTITTPRWRAARANNRNKTTRRIRSGLQRSVTKQQRSRRRKDTLHLQKKYKKLAAKKKKQQTWPRSSSRSLSLCLYYVLCIQRSRKKMSTPKITFSKIASELKWQAMNLYAPIKRPCWELSIGMVFHIAQINSSLAILEKVILGVDIFFRDHCIYTISEGSSRDLVLCAVFWIHLTFKLKTQ